MTRLQAAILMTAKELIMYTNIQFLQEWCENHGFEYKIVNDTFYWRTNYQTAILKLPTKQIHWERWEYYDNI